MCIQIGSTIVAFFKMIQVYIPISIALLKIWAYDNDKNGVSVFITRLLTPSIPPADCSFNVFMILSTLTVLVACKKNESVILVFVLNCAFFSVFFHYLNSYQY